MENLAARRRSPLVLAISAAVSLAVAACSSTPAPDQPPGGTGATSDAATGTAAPEPPAATGTQAVEPPPATASVAPASTAAPAATASAAASASASAAPSKPPSPSYVACGCGCCGGVTPQKRCLYHSKGDDLDKIIASDKAARAKPQCAKMGCSMGTEYTYCD